jgi:hypothetical protein
VKSLRSVFSANSPSATLSRSVVVARIRSRPRSLKAVRQRSRAINLLSDVTTTGVHQPDLLNAGREAGDIADIVTVAPADLDIGYLDGRGHRAPPSRCLRVRAAPEIVPCPSIGAFLPSPSTRAWESNEIRFPRAPTTEITALFASPSIEQPDHFGGHFGRICSSSGLLTSKPGF